MINWLIGAVIAGITIYVIYGAIVRLKKGQGVCDCSGCENSSCKSKPL